MSAPNVDAHVWRKSSYSANNGECVEVAFALAAPDVAWEKSSYSANNGACVEIALDASAVGARDSKDPSGPALWFPAPRWGRFVSALKAGRFDAA
ncbi:DUF397 domain-containing protein [Saccharopolyspora erythraea]|uniref:DUF397 domain-containing protein n=1 Tax=Saccharopolyspora erythraea TaxID=1836 RepID=UPI001BAE284A|nr:DUF397 domain-containing protein [Saccharopolyspora erythraea]QUH01734.1 DUF397 domain-containing protein [Saccharopolyspora erythraea]